MRRLLLAALGICAAAMLVVGAIGAFAVHESTATVDELSRELGPAQVSNAEFMQAMLDAETELRAYLISGEDAQLDDHLAALEEVPGAEQKLARYAALHPEMARLVARQKAVAASWIRDFARPAIAAGPLAADRDRAMFDLGVRIFDSLKTINHQIATRLQQQVAAARTEAQRRLDLIVGLIALIGICGALACGLMGWRVTRSIRRSLRELEDVVDRLAAGRFDARAPLTGPAEIRRLGAAINDMAEENARARGVEHQVQEQLLQFDRVKSEFVSNVSHELRTPLTSIAGYLELLSEDLRGEVDAEHADMMQVMQRNVVRLSSLIEDLLDLGRLEREPERLQEVDVARLVQDVAEELRLSASSRDVTISVDLGRSPVMVEADSAQLHRAVTNLLSNAVKFSYDGGDVRLQLANSGGQVEVSVSDTGIGIPHADQAKIGERFYRASNAVTAHIPGTGLGLRMVQAIVSNHHGTFGLSSQEGLGTTATMRLPLQRHVTIPEQNHPPRR